MPSAAAREAPGTRAGHGAHLLTYSAAMMRMVLLALLAALTALAPEARARRSAEPYPCALFPAPRPTRVLLLGDSNFHGPLGNRLVLGLEAKGYDVHLRGRSASGLANPEYFDWFTEARRVLDEVRPDAVVAMIGANDTQRITWLELRGRVPFKDEAAWAVAYEPRVRAFMQLLAADGRDVYYLSPTNRGWPKAVAAVTRVREVQRRVAAALPRVHWIDMFPLSSDAHGQWLREGRDESGHTVTYRTSDRIHLTKPGGDLVGARVLRALAGLGV